MLLNITKQSAGLFPALIFALFLILAAEAVRAETRYIVPSSEIAIRTGQGTDYKIIAIVKDGTAVELLEENDSYAKVRLVDGKEGWIIRRFLSEEPPLQELVASLQEENKQLKEKELAAIKELEELSTTLEQTKTELKTILAERDQIRSDYTMLQQDTADIAQIKRDALQTMQENKVLEEQLVSVNADYKRLKKEDAINWFLAGGGVLLVGLLFGRVSAGSRKRKPSLL